MWVTSRWIIAEIDKEFSHYLFLIIDRLEYFQSKFNMKGRRGENNDVTALGRWAVREHFVS